MNYNESSITVFKYKTIIGEKAVELFIMENKKVDYDDKTENNLRLIDALENYIIKKYYSPKSKEINDYCYRYVVEILNNYINNPVKYMLSPLTSEEFIEYVKANKEYKDRYKQTKVTISKQARKIYKKSITENLTEEERNLLSSFLIKNIDSDNPKIKEAIDNYAKKLLYENKSVQDTNTQDLRFLAYYANRFMDGKDAKKLVSNINIFEPPANSKVHGGVHTKGIIYINKRHDRLKDIDNFLHVVCHETRHAHQKIMGKTENNRIALEYAAHTLFQKYLSNSEYNAYKQCENYNYSAIEKDAENYGFLTARQILLHMDLIYHSKEEKGKDRFSKLQEKEEEEKERRQYEFKFLTGEDGNHLSSESFMVEKLNKIVASHPEEINEFPVLSKVYKKNGQVKTFTEIMTLAQTESISDENFYFYRDYIMHGIKTGELEKINIKELSKEDKIKTYKMIIKIFNEIANDIILHLRKTKDIINDGKIDEIRRDNITYRQIIKGTGKRNISRLKILLSFIEKNYGSMSKNEELINNNSAIFDLDLLRSDLDKISNINIENDVDLPYKNELLDLINQIIPISNLATRKTNIKRIKKELKKQNIDLSTAIIYLSEDNPISLKNYFEQYILNKTDKNGMYNTDEGDKIYIGELIKKLVENNLITYKKNNGQHEIRHKR